MALHTDKHAAEVGVDAKTIMRRKADPGRGIPRPALMGRR